MAPLFYAVNTVALLAFGGAGAFAFFSARAGAAVHHRYPTSISVFFFLLPAIAFLVSLFVAWRCIRGGTPSPGVLVAGLSCAAIATLATTALLAFAVELTVRRQMPGAIPLLVGIAFVGFIGLSGASALNLAVVARALVASGRGA